MDQALRGGRGVAVASGYLKHHRTELVLQVLVVRELLLDLFQLRLQRRRGRRRLDLPEIQRQHHQPHQHREQNDAAVSVRVLKGVDVNGGHSICEKRCRRADRTWVRMPPATRNFSTSGRGRRWIPARSLGTRRTPARGTQQRERSKTRRLTLECGAVAHLERVQLAQPAQRGKPVLPDRHAKLVRRRRRRCRVR